MKMYTITYAHHSRNGNATGHLTNVLAEHDSDVRDHIDVYLNDQRWAHGCSASIEETAYDCYDTEGYYLEFDDEAYAKDVQRKLTPHLEQILEYRGEMNLPEFPTTRTRPNHSGMVPTMFCGWTPGMPVDDASIDDLIRNGIADLIPPCPQSAWTMPGESRPHDTVVRYRYRDESGAQSWGWATFLGTISAEEEAAFIAALPATDSHTARARFRPALVGMTDLSRTWSTNKNAADGQWHDLVSIAHLPGSADNTSVTFAGWIERCARISWTSPPLPGDSPRIRRLPTPGSWKPPAQPTAVVARLRFLRRNRALLQALKRQENIRWFTRHPRIFAPLILRDAHRHPDRLGGDLIQMKQHGYDLRRAWQLLLRSVDADVDRAFTYLPAGDFAEDIEQTLLAAGVRPRWVSLIKYGCEFAGPEYGGWWRSSQDLVMTREIGESEDLPAVKADLQASYPAPQPSTDPSDFPPGYDVRFGITRPTATVHTPH